MNYEFYDQGWNDRCDKKPRPLGGTMTKSYRDGYDDCDATWRIDGPQEHMGDAK